MNEDYVTIDGTHFEVIDENHVATKVDGVRQVFARDDYLTNLIPDNKELSEHLAEDIEKAFDAIDNGEVICVG